MLHVDALERGGKVVGIALAAHLAVGERVDARLLEGADRQQCSVVLRLRQQGVIDTPQLAGAHSGHAAFDERVAVDQPVWLRIATHHGGRKKVVHERSGSRIGHVRGCANDGGRIQRRNLDSRAVPEHAFETGQRADHPVGPGTPMGDVMRQYWLPALLSAELPQPDSDPRARPAPRRTADRFPRLRTAKSD